MSKIETFLEGLTVGDIVMKANSSKETIVKKVKNAAKIASQLSRIALDLANASQRLDIEGNTVSNSNREELIKQKQAELAKAMKFAEGEENTNNYFRFDRNKWNRFKELLLDPQYPEKAGSDDAKSFSRDCVNFSKYIKKENHVPSPSATNMDELKYVINNSLKGNKRGDDYGANRRLDELETLYKNRDELIKKFEELAFKGNGDEKQYNIAKFRNLPENIQIKALEIAKKAEELDNKIEAFEKDEAKDYKLKAKVAQRNRYEALRGNINDTKMKLIQSLNRKEMADKFHSGISEVARNKLNNFNKGDYKIYDLKENPIDGCNSVKKLVNRWRIEGVKPNGQIEIVSQSIGGSGKFVVNIGGKFYSVPRAQFTRPGEGIYRNDSPDKGYVKNFAYTGDKMKSAVNQGKLTQEEADKYKDFLEKFKNASTVTESYFDY